MLVSETAANTICHNLPEKARKKRRKKRGKKQSVCMSAAFFRIQADSKKAPVVRRSGLLIELNRL
jgi:hypothetical protein